jgi:methylase of polypeptide subunit release factors
VALLQDLTPLEIVTRTADVMESLARFNRQQFDSGSLFDEAPFRRDGRADDLLLRDVTAATDALVREGLPRHLAHGLIERVILIRYMEDRQILLPDYLEEISSRSPKWREVFFSAVETPVFGTPSAFVRCLANRDLTDAVFARLAKDFNGDLFVRTEEERERVSAAHLELVQRLLTGAGFTPQSPLFLWAYDFSIVPTGLISSMYERFYRSDFDDSGGTHYTPQELVEFTTSQVLTEESLQQQARVCDPACGSGIFLVEAYRRIVRFEMTKRGRKLSTEELRDLLLGRVLGVDINPEAVRLAAFSLYLAFLGYQSPRDIRGSGPLPNLIASTTSHGSPVLLVADAFSRTVEEDVDDKPLARKFDVVIGNPPWDEPRGGPRSPADQWAREHRLTIGDRNPSQLFLWRALSLLDTRGRGALLVNATAFHNSRRTSRQFRAEWLDAVEMLSVVDFSTARRTFFSGAVAPFMLVVFRPKPQSGEASNPGGRVMFRTVRPSVPLCVSRSLSYASADRRWVHQDALRSRDYLWKVYAWGSHRDAGFMARLELEKTISDLLPTEPKPGWGYQRGQEVPSVGLASLPSLRSFEPWGKLKESWFEPPPFGVKRQPDERLYDGRRILIGRGVRVGFGPRSRLVNEPLSFRHTIYCLPVHNLAVWQAKIVWATLLSSLGRYSMFMRSGSWGLWHDSVLAEDILNTPVRLPPQRDDLSRSIVSAVESLERGGPAPDLGSWHGPWLTRFRESTTASSACSTSPFQSVRW